MRSWAAPGVPRLPGAPLPGTHGVARLYVCGITPYDAAHLGHAATYLAFDVMQRRWLHHGRDVIYVQNVTDVDDPLLERAARTDVPWELLAERETDRFRDEMEALRMLPPQHFVGVVESLDTIIEFIGQLGDTAYDVDGDLYFEVGEASAITDRSGLDTATMLLQFGERGGDPDRPGKRHPLDSLLWRAARPGEPRWDSPWGPGRPGWHVECAALTHALLGDEVDVIGGGNDLAFPHHIMCALEAEAATGHAAAKQYVHTGMVGYRGQKMSKSDGNLVFVGDLRDAGHDPMAIRLALLNHRAGDDWEWKDDEIFAAADRLQRWRASVARSATPPAPIDALADDVDGPLAIALIDAWAAQHGDADAGATMAAAIDALLGVAL